MQNIRGLQAERYELQELLGAGGMGQVYRGVDTQTGQQVAIKSLKPELADPAILERFQREGEALRRLNHPNIVKMLDAVQEQGQHYLIMELVAGGTLSQVIKSSGKLPIPRLLEIALDLADALTRAHRLNIIHRDIKPANVLLAPDGTPRLTDFGIAQVQGSEITETGAVIGTLAYLSPEALNGAPPDFRWDIWAFGVLLFEMLTGQPPFKSEPVGALITAILSQPVPDLETLCPDAPPALIDLIYRMLIKDPAERIPSVRLVGAELEALWRGIAFAGKHNYIPLQDSDDLTFIPPSPFITPTPSHKQVKNNLPSQSTAFVGREAELEALQTLLTDPSIRLVTILAPGGMGKTRLALEVAASQLTPSSTKTRAMAGFPDGVYFVQLAPLNDPENIAAAIAEAVDYPFQQDGRSPGRQLIDFFRDKAVLLVLDNFEHVIQGAGLVGDILQGTPNLKIIATSRERLNLSGENLYQLGGMDIPDSTQNALAYSSVRLFVQNARRVQSSFELTPATLPHLARICRLVQGMPLGLVLAAAWIELLSLEEIAHEIESNLDFLESEARDLPARQRSIRAVFDYSWQLMSEAERAALLPLAVFRGGMTREAAQKVTGASLRDLTALVNKSLLRRDPTTGRYEIHELLRQYAEKQLEHSGGKTAAQNAHSAYYLNFAAERVPDMKGRRQLAALGEIDVDFENVRNAWLWAAATQQTALLDTAAEGVSLYCQLRHHFRAGQALMEHTYPTLAAHPIIQGKLMVHYAVFYWANFHQNFEHLKPLLETSLATARTHHGNADLAFGLKTLGGILTDLHQFEEAHTTTSEAIDLYTELGDQFYLARVMDSLAYNFDLQGQGDKAREYALQSSNLQRVQGDKLGMIGSLSNLASTYVRINEISKSETIMEEVARLGLETGERSAFITSQAFVSVQTFLSGNLDRTRSIVQEVLPICDDLTATDLGAFFRSMLGCAEAIAGNYAEATKWCNLSLAQSQHYDIKTLSHIGLALTAYADEEWQTTTNHLKAILEITLSAGFNVGAAILPAVATLMLVHNGAWEQAAEVIGGISAIPANQIGWLPHLTIYTPIPDQVHIQLGDAVYTTAYERGRQLPPEEALQKLAAAFV